MNAIALIILAAIIADYFLNVIADYLNVRGIQKTLPDAFKNIYDQEKYEKSQEYLTVNTRFGLISSTFNVLLIVGFWFGKGFPLLDEWARSFS